MQTLPEGDEIESHEALPWDADCSLAEMCESGWLAQQRDDKLTEGLDKVIPITTSGRLVQKGLGAAQLPSLLPPASRAEETALVNWYCNVMAQRMGYVKSMQRPPHGASDSQAAAGAGDRRDNDTGSALSSLVLRGDPWQRPPKYVLEKAIRWLGRGSDLDGSDSSESAASASFAVRINSDRAAAVAHHLEQRMDSAWQTRGEEEDSGAAQSTGSSAGIAGCRLPSSWMGDMGPPQAQAAETSASAAGSRPRSERGGRKRGAGASASASVGGNKTDDTASLSTLIRSVARAESQAEDEVEVDPRSQFESSASDAEVQLPMIEDFDFVMGDDSSAAAGNSGSSSP